MAENYAAAASRHFRDAERLAQDARYDSAGHLVGFAAECAVKHCVESLRPANEAPHCHFPELIERAKRCLHGRRQHSLFTLLNQVAFMEGWRVADRYCDSKVTLERYQIWKTHALRTLGIASIRLT